MPKLPTSWTRQSDLTREFPREADREEFVRQLQANSQRYFAKLGHFPSPALFYVRTDSGQEPEYILKSSLPTPNNTRGRRCYLCNLEWTQWTLIGGGYQTKDSWFGALLREALPLVICETCFRVQFCSSTGDEVVAIGVAVLPELLPNVAIQRNLEIQRYLITLRQRYPNNQYFELDNFLLAQEIAHTRLRSSIHVRAHTGQVKILYLFTNVNSNNNQGNVSEFQLALARHQPGLHAVTGFHPQTVVRITQPQCLNDGLDIQRQVRDFYWLGMQLGQTKRFVPPLPHPAHLGVYNELFIELHLHSLQRFLVHCCRDADIRKHRALEAFFRPGYALARSVIECTVEDEHALTRFQPSLLPFTAGNGKASEFLHQCLLQVKSIEDNIHRLHDEFAIQVVEASPSTTTTTIQPDMVGVDFIHNRIQQANEQTAFWRDVQDFIND
ncbi:hypothetical protein BASA81_012504 [Batrachochytrium salamandrivorans]|nr:hypothetical protein BASA81_012504 [Batrachochytrium salamandrivorans]